MNEIVSDSNKCNEENKVGWRSRGGKIGNIKWEAEKQMIRSS